jgi:hypothetical protein
MNCAMLIASPLKALGVDFNKDVVREVAGSFDLGLSLMKQLMPVPLRSLHYPSRAVCTSSSPFLTAYLAQARRHMHYDLLIETPLNRL